MTRILIGTKWSLTTGPYINIKNESKKINERIKNKNTDRNSPVVMSGTLDEGTLGFNYPQSTIHKGFYE